MTAFLHFLTDADQEALLARAERKVFEVDDVIVREGEDRPILFLLHVGSVRVERTHLDFRYEVSRLGAGEVFGEMGIAERFVASAHVIANEHVEVSLVPVAAVEALADEDLGFAARFYRSVAEILSQRLRTTTVRSLSEFSWGGTDPGQRGGMPERYVPDPNDSWGGPSWDIDDDSDFDIDIDSDIDFD